MKINPFITLVAVALILTSCGGASKEPTGNTDESSQVVSDDPMLNKGIGPVTEVKLDAEINAALAEEGRIVYEQFCTACHKIDEKFIGPAPKDILKRRSPEWVMNMILNPEEMVQKDPIAKNLFIEANGAPMANQNLTEAQARAILEYFRTL